MTKISRGGYFRPGGVFLVFQLRGGIYPPGKTGSSAFSAIWALIKLIVKYGNLLADHGKLPWYTIIWR